jgi:hypothetical protein
LTNTLAYQINYSRKRFYSTGPKFSGKSLERTTNFFSFQK